MEEVEIFEVIQPLWFPRTTYGVSIVILFLFGIMGTILSVKYAKLTENLKEFVAATRTTGLLVISFAYFGPILGTSGIFVVSSYSGFLGGGWMAVASLTIYGSVVPLIIAGSGSYIVKTTQDVISFVHYLRYRYGMIVFILTLMVMLFDMAILILVEYTSIGAVYRSIVDPQNLISRPDILIIILVAGTVAIYTALGGLRVSLITDLAQIATGFVLLAIIVIYVGVTFKYPLTRENYIANEVGRNSVVGRNNWGNGLLVITVSFYDEANWQRVWASKDNRTMILGAVCGGVQIAIMILFAGTLGVLSLWAGLPPLDDSGNLTIFTVFEENLSSWIIVILVLCLLIQSQSFIDSMQNGMLATVLTIYVSAKEVWTYRTLSKEDKRLQGEEGFQQQLDAKFKRTSIEVPTIQSSNKLEYKLKQFWHSFVRTLGARVVVIAIQFVLVPLSFRNISILLLTQIQGNVTCMLFSSQILGLFISPKYYKQYMSLLSSAAAFITPHIYSHLKLKSGTTSLGIEYSPGNAFRYVWNPNYSNLDYGIVVSIIVSGFIATILFTSLSITIEYFKGSFRAEPGQKWQKFKSELFDFRVKGRPIG